MAIQLNSVKFRCCTGLQRYHLKRRYVRWGERAEWAKGEKRRVGEIRLVGEKRRMGEKRLVGEKRQSGRPLRLRHSGRRLHPRPSGHRLRSPTRLAKRVTVCGVEPLVSRPRPNRLDQPPPAAAPSLRGSRTISPTALCTPGVTSTPRASVHVAVVIWSQVQRGQVQRGTLDSSEAYC